MTENVHRASAKTCCSCVHYPGWRNVKNSWGETNVVYDADEELRCNENRNGSSCRIKGGMQGCGRYESIED